jgi:peptide/nickel transport system ATP-binding protein
MAPSPLALPVGCAFQGRCGFVDATCQTMPELAARGARRVRCHHPREQAAEVAA